MCKIAAKSVYYDTQVRSDLRGNNSEREVLEYADERTLEQIQQYDIGDDCKFAHAFRGDKARIELLATLGWDADNDQPMLRVFGDQDSAENVP